MVNSQDNQGATPKPWDYLGEQHQRQLDMDGVFVGVSRQAIDETLEHFETLTAALEDFDNWFSGFNPDDQSSRMEGRKVLIRARAAVARVRSSAA